MLCIRIFFLHLMHRNSPTVLSDFDGAFRCFNAFKVLTLNAALSGSILRDT